MRVDGVAGGLGIWLLEATKMDDLAGSSLADLSRALAARKISAVELAQAHLDRIEPHRNLNAFLDVRPEVTLAQAAAADARLAGKGDAATPLTGVPIAHKDIFVTKDFCSTAASRILRGYRSPFDATVVDNLKQAGMVTLGKLNCDEFAMGSSNENSAFGNVLNPWDTGAVPGGSSGGSSAAVAARVIEERPDLKLLITAFEVDDALIPHLTATLEECVSVAAERRVAVEFAVRHSSFVEYATSTESSTNSTSSGSSGSSSRIRSAGSK